MELANRAVVVKPNSYYDLLTQVYSTTGQLLYVLQAADRIRSLPVPAVFSPPNMSVGIECIFLNRTIYDVDVVGHDGYLVQPAYVGWLVNVCGIWEKCRRDIEMYRPKKGGSGLKAELFGDLYGIRNDLLHCGGIAQDRAGNCKILKWFERGQEMRFRLEHVLEFLHQFGYHMGVFFVRPGDSGVSVKWHVKEFAPEYQACRVVSTIVDVTQREADGPYYLLVSLMFIDGTISVFEMGRSDDPDSLQAHHNAISNAPRDEWNAPDFGNIDIPATYRHARDEIRAGRLPVTHSTAYFEFDAEWQGRLSQDLPQP